MATQQQLEEARKLLQQGDILGAQASKQTGIAYTPIAQITSVSLAPTTPITLPQPKPDTTNYNSIISGGQGVISANATPITTPTPPPTDLETRIKSLQA